METSYIRTMSNFPILVKTQTIRQFWKICLDNLFPIITFTCNSVTSPRSPYLPTRTVKSRQEAFLCIFWLKYYLLDHIYALYIQISHRIAFAAPQNNEFTTLRIALLTDKKFCEVALAVYVGCHSDVSVIPKTA